MINKKDCAQCKDLPEGVCIEGHFHSVDVEITVNRLNIENRTPEDTMAEKKIIEAMSKKVVRVVVIHKPTNENASFESPLPLVRKRAEQVVRAHIDAIKAKANLPDSVDFQEPPLSDYIVVEFDIDQVRVTSL